MEELAMEEELVINTFEKVNIYLDFIEIFVDTMKATKERKNIKNLGTRLLKTGLSLVIVAPDTIVKKYIIWRTFAMGGDTEKIMNAFADIIIEMRKDLIGKTECNIDDALDIFLQD